MASTGVTIRIVHNELPEIVDAMKPNIERIVKAHTLDLEARAKSMVPVKTGALRRSIHSVFSNNGMTGTVGPSVLYGKFVEFGTRRMGARPYMRPAAEIVFPRFLAAVKTAMAEFHSGALSVKPPGFQP